MGLLNKKWFSPIFWKSLCISILIIVRNGEYWLFMCKGGKAPNFQKTLVFKCDLIMGLAKLILKSWNWVKDYGNGVKIWDFWSSLSICIKIDKCWDLRNLLAVDIINVVVDWTNLRENLFENSCIMCIIISLVILKFCGWLESIWREGK